MDELKKAWLRVAVELDEIGGGMHADLEDAASAFDSALVAFLATPPAPSESVVREALAFFAGVPIGEHPGESYAEKFATANRYIAALSALPDAGRGREAAWRDGFQSARDCLSKDDAFTLTEDVEEDAWLDSKTRALKGSGDV